MLSTLLNKSFRSAMISLGGIVLATLVGWQAGLDESGAFYPALYGICAVAVNAVREVLKHYQEEAPEEEEKPE